MAKWLAEPDEVAGKVPCPKCGAKIGWRCTNRKGRPESTPHVARVRALDESRLVDRP